MNTFLRVFFYIFLTIGGVITASSLLSPLMILSVPLTLLCLAIGTIYVAVVLVLLKLSPLWAKPAPLWVTASLLWGGGMSMLLVMPSSLGVSELASAYGPDALVMSWAGGYPEEIAKAFGIFFILLCFRQFNRPWHGLLVGIVVGLGFEINENILYATMGGPTHPTSDLLGMLTTWGARLLAGPLLHAIFSGLAGWGIGWALYAANWSAAKRIAAAAGWTFVAFLLHFAWNFMPTSDVAYLIQIAVLSLTIYPLFIWVMYRAWTMANNDRSYSYSPGAVSVLSRP